MTGTRGQDPGYDPLAFAVEEAHKRGLELHVWVNPLRVTSEGVLDTNDPVWKNAGDWIIKYDNYSFKGQIIDPGYPAARAYVIKVLMEIVNNYDIDGILMDDYFYAYGGTKNEDVGSRTNNPAILSQTDHNYTGDKLDIRQMLSDTMVAFKSLDGTLFKDHEEAHKVTLSNEEKQKMAQEVIGKAQGECVSAIRIYEPIWRETYAEVVKFMQENPLQPAQGNA